MHQTGLSEGQQTQRPGARQDVPWWSVPSRVPSDGGGAQGPQTRGSARQAKRGPEPAADVSTHMGKGRPASRASSQASNASRRGRVRMSSARSAERTREVSGSSGTTPARARPRRSGGTRHRGVPAPPTLVVDHVRHPRTSPSSRYADCLTRRDLPENSRSRRPRPVTLNQPNRASCRRPPAISIGPVVARPVAQRPSRPRRPPHRH